MTLTVVMPSAPVLTTAAALLAALLTIQLVRRRRKPAATTPTPVAWRPTVHVLKTDAELAEALERVIASERKNGARSNQRVRHYARLMPEAAGVGQITGNEAVPLLTARNHDATTPTGERASA
jgi:hypothetical protein